MNLQTPITDLATLSLNQASALTKALDIRSLEDLLFCFPLRFLDRRHICKISAINGNTENLQCVGKVVNIHKEMSTGGKERLIVLVNDGSGFLTLIFFRSLRYITQQFQIGQEYLLFGQPKFFQNGYQMVHPEFELWRGEANLGLLPIYQSSEFLKKRKITHKVIANIIQTTIRQLATTDIPENLPELVLKEMQFPTRFEAFKNIHLPASLADFQQAKKRFIFEEFFFFQLRINLGKARRRASYQGHKLASTGVVFQDFYAKYLPFQLTQAQQRVVREIWADLQSGTQMNRLLQGDVGSGKTMVALLVALLVVGNGLQCALIAPTSTLAAQHFTKLQNYLSKLPVRIAFLHGHSKQSERRQILAGLESGEIQLLVGTHAVLEPTVQFKKLGLAIIDEQHKFGVEQRSELWKKGTPPPHMLVMTATPIPRTLAMSLYGDLDISTIDELPPRRGKITTIYRDESRRQLIYSFMKDEIAKGHQVYIVFPLIEESAKLELENLMQGYERIKEIFPMPKYRISLTHGQQNPEEKAINMRRFAENDTQIMVATTVIEVGIDVPNATVMLIENAERFGLSQLHQLRGRVGRGSGNSYCILLSKQGISQKAQKRLQLMTQTQDGFLLAEEDMKLRGPGDVSGTKQSGSLVFRFGDILADKVLLTHAQHYANLIIQQDNNLSSPANAHITQYLATKNNPNFWSHIS